MPSSKAPLLALVLLAITWPASADSRLDGVIAAAIGEHEVFLSCTAGDAGRHRLVRNNWEDMVEQSARLMTEAKVEAGYVRRFRERTAYENLMRRKATAKDLQDLCAGDWEDRLSNFRFVVLNQRVAAILKGR